jgi:fructose transport system permease protein
LVVFTAGIDLSVGAIMVLSSVVMGRLTIIGGVPVEISLIAGLLIGIVCGFGNGILVARLKLPPFIVTLGTWSIYGAVIVLISHSATIRSQDVENAAPLLQWLGHPIRLPGEIVLTYSSVLLVLLFFFAWYLINLTAFGRHLLATGDDAQAANLSGINTVRALIGTYVLAGAICGIAGWVLIGRIGAVSPYGSQSSNIDAITAVVIGGTSLFGGRGSVIGTLIGAIIVGVFRNGLALGGVEVVWQEFSVGALIIVAVIIDQWIRKISE